MSVIELFVPENNFEIKQGSAEWRSPSNIALVKYWGKYGTQLPKNPSISFTLSNSFSQTSLKFEPSKTSETVQLKFTFEEKDNPKFEAKIQTFLNSIIPYFPFLRDYKLTVNSFNSFPHSTGIASSASSMSALALCLCDMEKQISKKPISEEFFLRKASFIARLGSGSACRSVYPYLALWGKCDAVENSSNEWAIGMKDQVHEVFHSFQDSILIISSEEKSVSSRAGHALMENHTFGKVRFEQAFKNITLLLEALKSGDIETFGSIVEEEALTLHALMMTSKPSYILISPNTLKVIEKIRQFRTQNNIPVYFTLDAGPNVHILYPQEVNNQIKNFIQQDLLSLCEGGKCIHDQVAEGIAKLDNGR
jgi:diphosphomevalonate decarboxylase